jgi:Transposase, Mutator family
VPANGGGLFDHVGVSGADVKEQANAKGSPIRDRRERLHQLLDGARDRDSNIISVLVAAVSELVVQELVEGEQADFLGGRGHYQRRGERQRGFRNGYEPRRIRTAEGRLSVQVPQVRGADGPFRSALMSFLEGNSDLLDRLVTEMYARGMSTRDIEDAFRDVTGERLISKSAVSEITDRQGRTTRSSRPGPAGDRNRVPVHRRDLRILAVRIRCWFDKLANIGFKLRDETAGEVLAHIYAARDAPTLDAARAAVRP